MHRILYIDDDQDDLEVLADAFERIGNYELVKASDGIEGLSKLEGMKETSSLPCLIILDLNMPRMDGKQTFVEIKKKDGLSNIPIVIFSTSQNPMDKMFFEEKVEYIVKPVRVQGLVETVERMLHACGHLK
jgi:CheY-like chemotaxis protein